MLKIYDTQSAKQTLLKRPALDDMPIPPLVEQRIEALFGEKLSPEMVVDRILKDVRLRGDAALLDWTGKLDGCTPDEFPISPATAQTCLENLDAELRGALELAADRIRSFHQAQPLTSWMTQTLGGTLGQFIRPVKRVGLYIPGGTAPLVSTLLMSVIPAQVAGVKEIVLATPPQRPDGSINKVILAAAALCGITEIYPVGGAQAIAALAYGTQTIHPVDKIIGPGNLFVTLAKRRVFGIVGLDGLAGPTETVIIADDSARPDWLAADLLAQAEHDVLAASILLTPSQTIIDKTCESLVKQLNERKRIDIIRGSLDNRSGAVLTSSLEEAVELANQFAPEHLCLAVREPWRLAEKITCAGGIFLGDNSFEVLGDYVAGPSHVMPTGGTARFSSPLNILDFVHVVSLIALDPQTTAQIAPAAAIIANSEWLDAHAAAALIRL